MAVMPYHDAQTYVLLCLLRVVLLLIALAAPIAMGFGFAGALASRSPRLGLRFLGNGYLAMIRGVPEIVFFLFIPIALDQAFEYMRHHILCPEVTEPIRQGNDFVVCDAANYRSAQLINGCMRFMALPSHYLLSGSSSAPLPAMYWLARWPPCRKPSSKQVNLSA